ncbi:MAG: iron-containing alcohol dehydrogenase [Anaerolineae bacterium]|nr:iron-containing alcohol dehydrogenase [Anaerolineae bacterium]
MAVWPLPRISFRELSSVEETRPVALLTTDEVWAVLSTQLTLPVMIQAEPDRYDRELFDYLAANLPSQVQVVYAVGGGAQVEAGKIIAAQNGIPLVIIPTALDSCDMLLPTALVEETADDRTIIVTEETGPATEIIIDWNVIQAAPADARGAAIVDILSVVTGLLDWRYAAQKSKNPREQRFRSWAAGIATGLAKQALKSAAAIGQGNRDALQTLLHLMLTVVQLNNQLEHTRAQQGSEHYLAHILKGITEFDLPHAELVAQCLLFVQPLHGQNPAPIKDALEQAGVPLDAIRPTDFALMLQHLPAYVEQYDFPYSILNDLDLDDAKIQTALAAAGLDIAPDTWKQPTEEIATIEPDTLTQPAAENDVDAVVNALAEAAAEVVLELGSAPVADAAVDLPDEFAPDAGEQIDFTVDDDDAAGMFGA